MIDWIEEPTFNAVYKKSLEMTDPGKGALIYKDRRISYAELEVNIRRMQKGLLEAGVRQEMHVGYSLTDSPEIFYLVLALLDLGVCIVPLHPRLPAPAKAHVLRNCAAEFFITGAEGKDQLEQELREVHWQCNVFSPEELMSAGPAAEFFDAEVGPDSLALLISSSGTTGQPKYIEINQQNLANVVKTAAALMRPLDELAKGIICMFAFPLTSSGITTITSQLVLGMTILLLDDYSPLRFLELISTWKPGVIGGTPGYLQSICSFPGLVNYDVTSIKRVYSGMDYLSSTLVSDLREHFPGLNTVSSGYGLAETTTVVMDWHAGSEEEFQVPVSHLKLLEGADNEIDIQSREGVSCAQGEEGELMIRGPSVMRRYFGNPQETKVALTPDGWLRTGDIASRQPDGRICLLGRKKYIIKRGGFSVSPLVVHAALLKLPGLAEAAVVGVPHPLYGQMIWAFLRRKGGMETAEGEVFSHCRRILPPYMVPDQITFLEKIPKTPGAGKLDQEKLIEMGKQELIRMSGGQNE